MRHCQSHEESGPLANVPTRAEGITAIQESTGTHPHAMAFGATVQTSVAPFPDQLASPILSEVISQGRFSGLTQQ